MNKPTSDFPFNLPAGFPDLSGAAKESFDTLSRAYAEWMQNANRAQAEMIRFLGERYTKDVSLVSRFANCKQPDEFMKLQAQAMSEIASDYMQEGAKLLSLFGEASKEAFDRFVKTTGGKRSG